MPSNKAKVRRTLQQVCSRYLWCAVPTVLEDYICVLASSVLDDKDIYDSSHGPLFEIAVDCAHRYHAGLLDLDSTSDLYVHETYEILDNTILRVVTVYDALITIDIGHEACIAPTREMSDDEFERWCMEGYYSL